MQHFPVDHPFYLCHLLQHLYTLMLDKTFVSDDNVASVCCPLFLHN